MRNSITSVVLLLTILFIAYSCNKDNTTSPDPNKNVDYQVNDFIWSNLSAFYLWTENVPKLSPNYFSSQSSYDDFINQNTDHEAFFESLLYKYGEVDKWSWIVDDYTELENELQGISKTNGIDFRLGRFTGTNNIFGFVRYVMKGSPADIAGVKRGNLFTKINNTQLNMDNYIDLLFNTTSYSIEIDTLINSYITTTGRVYNLTAIEFQENPIYLDTVYTINNKKIGYLVYNSFINKYSYELNNVFLKFKNKAIDELIIDLRYNYGGDESNMIGLASMIYSTNTGNVFMQTRYNTDLQNYIVSQYGEDFLKKKFMDRITVTNGSNQTQYYNINCLNLGKLHVITSDNSASASEVLICGLKPYIPVAIIGDTTVGKYAGSITLKDEDNQGVVNPNHKWAMQPIVMRVSNKDGITDYVGGYLPDYKILEQFTNLNQLGNIEEPLLNAAINYINGTPPPIAGKKSKMADYTIVAESKDAYPHQKGLKVNPIKIPHDLKSMKAFDN